MMVVVWVDALKPIFIFLFMNLFSYKVHVQSDKNILNEKGKWVIIYQVN